MLSLVLAHATGQADLSKPFLALVHRLRRPRPVPERLHPVLSAGGHTEEAGRRGRLQV
ncbi:MAG: hypothetical protein MZW92_79970 [Comamonadaceae bacterium]|nr:hypothetical protein [Comamonadaceae bacterium]